MPQPLIDPRMLGQLGVLFNSTVTIQVQSTAKDAVGQPVQAWTNLANHVALPCAAWNPTGKAGGLEQRLPDGTFLFQFSVVLLQGYYPAITEAMRAVVNGGTPLDIMKASSDSQSTYTELTCQLVR